MTRINFFSRFCTLAIVAFTAVGCLENSPTAAPAADNNQGGMGNPSDTSGNGGMVNPDDKNGGNGNGNGMGTGNGGQQADGNNVWIVNGDGFRNQKIYGITGWGQSSFGRCNVGLGSVIAGESGSVAIMFDGVRPVQYYWGSSIGNMITLVIGQKAYMGVQGVTTITRIDGPGGRIQGTFEGTMANTWDGSRQIKVKGNFDVPMQL